MKKNLLSILFTLLPILASAETVEIDGIWYNLISKAKEAEVTENPNKYKGKVEIPTSVTYNDVKYNVTSIGNSAFSYCSGLTSITIPNSVVSISKSAFQNCSSLTSVTIPNNVTSIGNSAFQNCSNLTSVTIPNSVTSIGNSAFEWCSGLTSVTIPNSVTSIGSSAFSYCICLTSITIPNSVTSISDYTFSNSSLISITIPNSVTSIGRSAFSGCSGLTSASIPISMMSIGDYAFQDCSGLTSITIPNSVTSIGFSTFGGCSSLTSVTIPNSVTSIGDFAFRYCSGLTSVMIPNSVTSIGGSAFSGCSSLTSVTIGENVTNIGGAAFANCDELTDVYCMAKKVSKDNSWNHEGLYTYPNAFKDSYPQYIILHVQSASIEAYRTLEPWSQFKAIVALEDGDKPKIEKCATPEISYENGRVKFTCETKDVEYISSVTLADEHNYYDDEIQLSQMYKITVYATKAGYDNSDMTTREIVITGNGQAIIRGDANGDGKVDAADIVTTTNIIMEKK